MALDQKDLELIERILSKNGDDVTISIARSFERLEERIDATESRLYTRMDELEDKIVMSGDATDEVIGEFRAELRERLPDND